MANPLTAKPFDQALDPTDELDFYVILNQGSPDAKVPPLLLLGEAVATYTLSITAEGVTVGLMIVERIGFQNQLDGNVLKIWFDVTPSLRASRMFDGVGVTVAIELTIWTTLGRRKQRSFLMRISNQ